MKNKLFVGAAVALGLITLAGCKTGNSNDYSYLRKDVDSSKYDLDFKYKTNLVDITDEANYQALVTTPASDSYYQVYVGKNAESSLFQYQYNLDEYFQTAGDRNQKMTISTLALDNPDYKGTDMIYDEEKTGIVDVIFSETTGVSKVLTTVGFTVFETAGYTRVLSTADAYKAYTNKASVSLSVVYLPVIGVHYNSGIKVLEANLFVPVYATFVTADGKEVGADGALETSKVASIATPDLEKYVTGVSTSGKIKFTA